MWRDIAPLCGITEAFDAAEAAAFIGKAWKQKVSRRCGCTRSVLPDMIRQDRGERLTRRSRAKAMLESRPARARGTASGTLNEAVRDGRIPRISGRLKALGIAHKSEHSAVRLNLRDADAVQIRGRASSQDSASGLYVERMVTGGGCRAYRRRHDDPQFGPVMTLGTGGVLVELLQDTVTVLLPSSREDMETALRASHVPAARWLSRQARRPTLSGRHRRNLGIAAFAVEQCRAASTELDINPLLVCGEGRGAWIADALLVPPLKEPRAEREATLKEKMTDVVRTRREGGILEVTLDRPKANAIDLRRAAADGRDVSANSATIPSLRVAIVKTEGDKFFCAGWDLKAAAARRRGRW